MAHGESVAWRKNRLISDDISRCDIIVPVLPQLLHGRFVGVGR
jgi:hypothetical protein